MNATHTKNVVYYAVHLFSYGCAVISAGSCCCVILNSKMYNRSSFPFTLDCVGSNTLLTESKGQLASPAQGGSGVCAWLISVPKDLRIIFYFQSYNIDSSISSYRSVPECSDQDTRIELKDSPTDPPWRTYCERNMPEPIATDKSVLFVQFKLPKSDSKSWFTAEYITFPFEHGEYGYRPYVM